MSCHASKVKTLLFTVCFTLAGCGSSGTSPDQNDNGTTSSKTSIFDGEDFLSYLENSRTLPKSVKTISELLELDCNTIYKCGKVFVEDKDIYEYFQCDGTEWLPAKNTKFKKLCSIKKEESSTHPQSVKSFMDLASVECNENNKCEHIFVEDLNDTYECDGIQWSMLLNGISSNACPTEAGIIGLDDASYEAGKIACAVSSTNPYVQETRMNDLRTKSTVTLSADGKLTEVIEYNQVIPKDTCDHYKLDPAYESVECNDQTITTVGKEVMKSADFGALIALLSQFCKQSNGADIPEAAKDDEGAESESPESSTSTAASTDSNTDSANSGEGSANSGSKAMVSCNVPGVLGECLEYEEGTEDASQLLAVCTSVLEGTLGTGCTAQQEEDKSSSSGELTGPTGDVVSCLQEYEVMGTKSKACTEATANSETATQLMNVCMSIDGFLISTLGNGCPATGFVKKCIVSNEAATYYFDDDAANKSCEELSQS